MKPQIPTITAMSNAERQRAWRARNRPAKRTGQFVPPPDTRPPLPPPEPALDQLGPEALFEKLIRPMPPAKKLYLAMLIMDDLNALAGKRKARRNQQYIVQAMQCANELAQLPEPVLDVEDGAAPALEQHVDQPLLTE